MKKIIAFALFTAAVMGLTLYQLASNIRTQYELRKPEQTESFGSFSGAATVGSSTVTTASTPILSLNPNRYYAAICNDSATNVVYLGFGAPAVAGKGYRLNTTAFSDSCYEINDT